MEIQEMRAANTPRLPEIGEFVRHHGTLVAVEVIPPPPQPPPQKVYIFEAISARADVLFRGEVFKHLESHNDFWGLRTSVPSIVELAQTYAAHNEITPSSDLEVVAVEVVSYFRARPLDRENFYAREFVDFQWLERGAERGVPEARETVVWTSRESTGEQQEEGNAS